MHTSEQITSVFKEFIKEHTNHIHGLDTRKVWIKDLKLISNETYNATIDFFESIRVFSNCFISSQAYFDMYLFNLRGIVFKNCTIEVPHKKVGCFDFLEQNRFVNCTIYINELTFTMLRLSRFYPIFLNLENDNTIVNRNYIEQALLYYNDLNELDPYKFKGMSLFKIDLTNVSIPKDINFFKDAFDKDVSHCYLPAIDFTSFNKDDLVNLNFSSCVFHKNTIFPLDKDFFLNNQFSRCYLPSFDYRGYNMTSAMLTSCYFTRDSILPNCICEQDVLSIIEDMNTIPDKHISDCVQFAYINNIEAFIKKYDYILSNSDKFLLINRNSKKEDKSNFYDIERGSHEYY